MVIPLIGKVVVNDVNALRIELATLYIVGQIKHNGDFVFRVTLVDGWVLNVFTAPVDNEERFIRILGICDADNR